MSIIDRLLRRKREIPEVIFEALQATPITIVEREKAPSITLLNAYEKLYRGDSITFACVNYILHRIVQDVIFKGNIRSVRKIQQWSENVGFKRILEDVVRDILVYGNGWLEVIPSRKQAPKLRVLNPKYCDYKRDLEGNVELDEWGEPLEVHIDYPLKKYIITKDEIKTSRDEVLYSNKIEDLRKRYVQLTLYTFGDSYTGISLLQPILTSIIIRGNISKMTGELAYRAGGIVAYVSGAIPEESKKRLLEDLRNVTKRNIFVMSDKIQLQSIPIPEIRDTSLLLCYLVNEQCAAMGLPYELILAPIYRGRQIDLTNKLIDFESRILSYQHRLSYQINNRIMPYVNKYFKTNVKFQFLGTDYNVKLTKARIMSGLARRGLIVHDKHLEDYIRREMGLPVTEEVEQCEY